MRDVDPATLYHPYCEICGRSAESEQDGCICPECPICQVHGDIDCVGKHYNQPNEEPTTGLVKRIDGRIDIINVPCSECGVVDETRLFIHCNHGLNANELEYFIWELKVGEMFMSRYIKSINYPHHQWFCPVYEVHGRSEQGDNNEDQN